MFDKVEGPCPALEDLGDKYVCGLVTNPEMYSPVRTMIAGKTTISEAALFLIGSGVGCDGQEPGEPDNPEYRAKLMRMSDKRKKTANALRVWGLIP